MNSINKRNIKEDFSFQSRGLNKRKEEKVKYDSVKDKKYKEFLKQKIIDGDLNLENTKTITSLDQVEIVYGALILSYSSIIDLGNLKYVDGITYITNEQRDILLPQLEERNIGPIKIE